jgi:alpha-amylase
MHYGSEEDLMELSNALHSRNMFLMVDVVVNQYADFSH